MSRFASKPQLLNVTAGAAAILNHSAAFGIRIAPFDLHRPNAGNARDETGEEAVAFSFGFDARHSSKLHAFGISWIIHPQRRRQGGSLFRYSEMNFFGSRFKRSV